eukprot:8942006-Pyramimonas_sp.AAC.1
MPRECVRRRRRSSHEVTTRGRDGNAFIDALVAADENAANYDRHVGGRQGSERPGSRVPFEDEHFVSVAEFAGGSLAKNASSQSACIVAICRSGRHRSVA